MQGRRQPGAGSMINKTNRLAISQCLIMLWCFSVASANAAVVNLTYSEDVSSFTSTWRITDNGSGDFSGIDTILGAYWQIQFSMDSSSILQDSVGHVAGPHSEGFISSSLDYGMLSTGFVADDSFVLHENGHRDDFSFSSEFVGGAYELTFAGAHSVPIPATLWLFVSGLGMLGWMKRQRT
jgi:hypothetical protein